MKLETYRTRTGDIAVKGEDFKIIIEPNGCIAIHFNDQTKNIDWIFLQREKRNAVKTKGESK
jgi:hypothetical protein